MFTQFFKTVTLVVIKTINFNKPQFPTTDDRRFTKFFKNLNFVCYMYLNQGWVRSKHQQGLVSANQSYVVVRMEPFNWTRATELYLSSNQIMIL